MEPILTWLVVGLVAGVLASMIVGGAGYGILGDIVVGIAGSFVGSWVFREFGWHAPFDGIAGVIAVAFVGALILLLIVGLISPRSRYRSRR